MDKVLVLLAAYNGEKYVAEMIDSVIAQDYSDWEIILSDDCSTDNTLAILQEYADKMPTKIKHYRSGMRFGCAQKHFMHLLERFHDAPYIMFCDQDDIWHSDKIRKTYEKMLQTEQTPKKPAMVHTDLRVVDAQLREISPSFCELSNLDGNRMGLNQLLVQNVVTGCTMMINRALAELAVRNIPETGMLMHDGWLALLASACGSVGFLDEATIDYRQHGNNSVGAKNTRSISYMWQHLRSQKGCGSLANAAYQAEMFLGCFADQLSEAQKTVLADFASTRTASVLKRDKIYLKHGLLKHGTVRIVAQFMGM